MNGFKAQLDHHYTCAFRGSRDHYQAALALHEEGRLDRLVTDFYTPDWAVRGSQTSLAKVLNRRRAPGLSSRKVSTRLRSAVPLRYGMFDGHKVDDGLGRRAAALTSDAALIYSYYWHGFITSPRLGDVGPRVVFQVHPMASQIRQILRTDRERSGIGAALEPEERLSPDDVCAGEAELMRADGFVATSNFVRRGIQAAGAAATSIGVAPYGAAVTYADVPSRDRRSGDSLRLLYIGQLSYRKGIHWLVQAMRELEQASRHVTLTVVSRDTIPAWLGTFPANVTYKHGLSNAEVARERAQHDMFILPSLVEGFGLVYLEALAAGLPIIATHNSGAPEILSPGENGLFVEPGSVKSILQVVDELSHQPQQVAHLAAGVRGTKTPTWSNFRGDLRKALQTIESSGLEPLSADAPAP
jgi:glycosyltransferase involved in cell wall biosynthesis